MVKIIKGYFIINPQNYNQIIDFITDNIYEFNSKNAITEHGTDRSLKYIGKSKLFLYIDKKEMMKVEVKYKSIKDTVMVRPYESMKATTFLDDKYNLLGEASIICENNQMIFEL